MVKLIKDYAKEPKIGADFPKRPMPAIVLLVFALVLITAFTLILLSLNPDQRIEGFPIVQEEPIIPAVKPEPLTIIHIQKNTTPNFTFQVIFKQTAVKPTYVKEYASTPKDPPRRLTISSKLHRLSLSGMLKNYKSDSLKRS